MNAYDTSAKFGAQVAGGRQVIGMHVGLQQPLKLQPTGLDISYYLVGHLRIGQARDRVIAQHCIDHGALRLAPRMDHMSKGRGDRIEERANIQTH